MPLPKNKTAKELNIKVGDKFRVVREGTFHVGDIIVLVEDDGSQLPWFREVDNEENLKAISLYKLEPLSKTLETLSEGDVVVKGSYEKTILGVCGKAYVVSKTNKPYEADSVWTAKELEIYGYKLKNQPEQKVTEVSMNEVADKFGVPVDKLKIRKD